MKKIFYFLLLMLSGVVWGQPNIEPLEEGKYLFEDLKLESHVSSFDTSGSDCAFSGGETYKYFSFKANFDMVFAFDLIASQSDFRFIVWKVQKGKNPNVIFDRGTTIKADGSVQGSTNLKGMKEGVSNKCESNFSSSATGYVKAFDGTNILKEGETVVIAVYGGFDNVPFDIKVNVAEEREIPHSIFNNLCEGQAYSYQQVVDAIKSHISSNSNPVTNPDIKLYRDNTFSTLINDVSTTFNTNTTLYAQVRDTAGNLKFIYTIPISFIPEHQFNFKPTFETEYACTPTYTIPDEDELLNKLFPTVDSNYSISSIVIDGTSYTSGQNVNLAVGQTTSMKIKVHYGGGCPIDSHEVSIPLAQGKPTLSGDIYDTTCDSSYKINFDRIYSKFGKDKNAFDLIVTLDGLPISDGQPTAITTTLTYKVKIKSRTGGGCESDEVNFVVTKTQPATIVGTEIKDFCINDPAFTPTQIGMAVNRIQNGNNYNLRYYLMDGTEAQMSDLYEYLKEKMNGKIIVKALAADNGNTICDTVVELNFSLDESTFIKVDNIPTLNSTCAEVGAGYMFAKAHIESYLKTVLGTSVSAFQGISNETLADNQSKTISFKVQKTGESCWSEEMMLKLQVITRPNVVSATFSSVFCEGETLTIDDNLLRDNFGANVFDYKIYIDGSEYIQGNSIKRELDFGGNTSLNISVEFKNRLSDTCSMNVDLTVNKKPDLIVDETYTFTNEIVYCEGEDENAKNQIEAILDYINSQEPGLVAALTVDEIFAQIDSNEGFVNVDFEDPNYCGTATIKFYFKRNPLPNFEIPTSDKICSDSKFEIDFKQLARDKSLDVTQYNFSVVGDDAVQISTYQYELGVGDYIITISDIDSGCPKEFSLKLTNSETPVIDKITINETSIIVTAKGNGKLEYALFDSVGNVIVDWQTKNELIIPDNIKNNNFTVRVRLNNCGVSERKNVIYLALPNVVTPNQDGKNDVWKPMTKNGKINDVSNSYKLIIFDRYGKQILSKEGTNIIEWDGTHNGKPVADGTYWYMLESNEELQVLYSGYIVVKRKIN